MRDFAALFEALDTTTATNLQVAAMARYFRTAPPADAAWAAYLLSGRRLKRFIGPAMLRGWLTEAAGLPEWLVEEAHASVGDLAETVALLVAPDAGAAAADIPLADWIEQRLLVLRSADPGQQRETIVGWWRALPYRECFLLTKLLTGALRVGVSELLVTRALSEALGVPRPEIARRMMGDWQPGAAFWNRLRATDGEALDPAAPYPFHRASPLDADPASLGARADWLVEWKWDGIRAQIVRRAGQCFIWSRGEDLAEELMSDRFPELTAAAAALPDGTVLDGEIVAWRDDRVQPFAELQQRIGRRRLAAVPVRFLAYDLLEQGHEDVRPQPLLSRRAQLEQLLHGAPPAGVAATVATTTAAITLSPVVTAPGWETLATLRGESRARAVEGLMLKRRDSPYRAGREHGSWWNWKIEPYTFDAVLLYAQPGHGRRSNLYTDYTFGVWRDGELVPVTKACSGLSDAEIVELDRWIRDHTRERFGPVRALEPTQVFELAYEGIAESGRHKSGIALRFPRILRWRTDKPASEADTLASLRAVLAAQQQTKSSPTISSP